MQQNLVIVESPAKAKTIEKFLGKGYRVMSSFGHIRDLRKQGLGLDEQTMTPAYVVPDDKKKIVADLTRGVKSASKVWLASDEDREGEAISWHLCEVLGLDEATTSRIVFHEITREAIAAAIEHPRHIDMNLVNAQQARRVLDRLVGFKLSPVLWRKVKPALSAGRVQSVAVRLIVEREREIQQFVSEPYYRVTALLLSPRHEGAVVRADLDRRFHTHAEALDFLARCQGAALRVSGVSRKPLRRAPAPPFTTSTLQQEAARKLGLPVSQTMLVAQHLYENGLITYMRTDSVNLSSLAIGTSKQEIARLWGERYSHPRRYQTHSKGAQEAHEAIRPTYVDRTEIEGTPVERKLYELIWKRTVASQMAEAELEKTTVTIDIEGQEEKFVATGEVVTFDGFLKVYRESTDDEEGGGKREEVKGGDADEAADILPPLAAGDELAAREIVSTEKYPQGPARYTEASLVKKMEELGIGRPSTYAPTITTIQQREYVAKGEKRGEERTYRTDTLRDGQTVAETHTETAGREKGKLLPTDTGIVVNDFLMENFPDIMDYNFTASVERQFDQIAEGEEEWTAMMRHFDTTFSPVVERVMNTRSEHRAGERTLGDDPATGKPVFVKIGRFGPVVQIGAASEQEKPRFAHIPKDKSIETITLDEALALFATSRSIGEYEGEAVTLGAGRYGPYVQAGKLFVSIPKGKDPASITLDEAIELIRQKREQVAQRVIKTFDEDSSMQVLNGRYGPYIVAKGKNYRLPKAQAGRAAELTYEECAEIVRNAPEPRTTRRKK